ncbi:sigma factor [Dyella sp.]|uniref:sigma factor n=1 Tax=Dyella sp. TaxID=1869338 RepID=UPI003F81440A
MDANGSCCRLATDRLPNDALVALMVAAIERGTPPCAQLLEEATSVFTAFFRGQVLAARIHEAELAPLVAEALTALHRHYATFDSKAPFRAWLLDTARRVMVDYQRRQNATAGASEVTAPAPHSPGDTDGSPRTRHRERRPAGVC